MKILVTGNLGYIGPYLVKFLRREGHFVTGCDLDLFHESRLEKVPAPHLQLIKDFRHLSVSDLSGIDCIVHLAGISNDPMGNLDEHLTHEVNYTGSVQLALNAREAGVSRFLFSSSCSIYGKSGDRPLQEDATLSPLTAYASSKIAFERFLDDISDENFITAYLRNSTAFGYSPVFRIDLVVNNLLACALTKKKISIKSDGEPWRPLLHCSDIAKAFLPFIAAPGQKINKQAVNIGANSENYQVKDIADAVKELVPDAVIEFTGEVGEDPRNYKVSFDKLNALFPDYQPDYTLRSGMLHLKEKLITHHFSVADFEGDVFTRLKLLQKHISLLHPSVT